MNLIIRLSLCLSAAFLIYSCSTSKKLTEPQNVIMPLSGSNIPREGSIIYGLPRTVFTFNVEFERTIEKPGPYARYASDLLGLDNVITSENESWSIEAITVTSREELDPSEYYIIESTSLFQTNVLALRKEGLILDIDPDTFRSSVNFHSPEEQEANQISERDLGSDEYYMIQRDTAYKRLSIDSSFVRVPYVVEKKKRLSTDQLAERAAKRLMELRDGEHMILTGEANVFPQSDAAINEINRLEKEYMELFTGRVIKEKVSYTYHVIPAKDAENKPVVLFQFSDLTGPSAGNANSATAVTAEFLPEQKTKDITIIRKQKEEPAAPVYDKLYYRVPDVVNLKVARGPEVFLNTRRLVYQFGQVIQLPANYIIGK